MVASIGKISSPSQGASYYEKDGYYARDDPAHREASAWAGKGADALGLSKGKGDLGKWLGLTGASIGRDRPANLKLVVGGDPQDLIARASVVCGFTTTALLEAIAAGKPVVVPRFAEAAVNQTRPYFLDLGAAVEHAASAGDLYGQLLARAVPPVPPSPELFPPPPTHPRCWTIGRATPTAGRAGAYARRFWRKSPAARPRRNKPGMPDRPWVLLPIETKVREFHAKILQSAVAAERGFDVVLGEQNAMIRQMPCLPRGVYVDKSVARTKTQPFRRLTAAGNKVAAWCEEGLVYRDRDNYLHERVSGDSLAHTDMFFAWGQVQADDVGGHVPAARDKIQIIGNPRFDVLRPELRALFHGGRDALRQRFGRYILVATNFSRYNHFMGYEFWIEALKKRGTITTPEQLAFFQRWREYLGELYRGFASALPGLARAFPDHHFVVRPHPSEDH